MAMFLPATLNITPTDRYRLREIADAAYAYGVSLGTGDYDNDKLHYIAGVEDVLRFIVGDAAATSDLAEILPTDEPEYAACAKCGRSIVEADFGVWYHADSGLPPCDPSQVDPDAYLDIEGDKYDIATPNDGSIR